MANEKREQLIDKLLRARDVGKPDILPQVVNLARKGVYDAGLENPQLNTRLIGDLEMAGLHDLAKDYQGGITAEADPVESGDDDDGDDS